ncbi:MAG TPA: formylmethanofuran dehydrogenase subunit A [Methyloceanibacter sp.]|nr:formylmethanofuran dehydrogenase subunit A [Methyloceanibacter sp.]
MLILLQGGRVVDPAHDRDAIGDVFIEDGRIVAAPTDGRRPDATYDLRGKIVMAGGVDLHSHIAGSNVTLAREIMPELPALAAAGGVDIAPSPATWGSYATGLRYAQMGYTTVIEPALIPTHAIEAQIELAAIPIIDVGALGILGNDDYSLGLLRGTGDASELQDYVAWTLSHAKCLGLKVINAGGAEAFKFNVRTFSLDDEVPDYGVTSRAIMRAMQKAVTDLGVPHPVHLHCNNLGVAGNADTALATMEAAEGLPIHLAHIQFYGYGKEGPKGLSSAAPRIAEGIARHKNVSVDIGQVMFGQTVTISGDILRQFDGRNAANPKKWGLSQGEGNGTGVVPYKYRAKSFVNAVQWSVGLEIMLLADDLWRVLFSTDHPNGALFVRYPEIIQLLMDRNERARWLERLPQDAREVSNLAAIARELTYAEIAIITRAGPARLLGLQDRGHLGPGAVADVAVYVERDDKKAMFEKADYVFKDGRLVVRDGAVTEVTFGRAYHVAPGFDSKIERRVADFYDRYYGAKVSTFGVPDDIAARPHRFAKVPCQS